ncbi:hypothetical protein ADIS_3202 [Lunatimonas lonarensis]|uniref:Uncharacterized protein n=1 Tax=Lunatimonas lonarensis TaxID=1232681 RepID=R7ZPX9_9BACT|nr:hypothetical protein ADIS_3202 [Lunatimonas lonarensis]
MIDKDHPFFAFEENSDLNWRVSNLFTNEKNSGVYFRR